MGTQFRIRMGQELGPHRRVLQNDFRRRGRMVRDQHRDRGLCQSNEKPEVQRRQEDRAQPFCAGRMDKRGRRAMQSRSREDSETLIRRGLAMGKAYPDRDAGSEESKMEVIAEDTKTTSIDAVKTTSGSR